MVWQSSSEDFVKGVSLREDKGETIMPIFLCDECGYVENTACSFFWHWTKTEKKLCSACDPRIGKWHGRFERRLPTEEDRKQAELFMERIKPSKKQIEDYKRIMKGIKNDPLES